MPEEIKLIHGQLRNLERRNDQILSVELWLMNGEVNRNKWKFHNLKRNAPLFAGTPILTAYVNNGKQVGDGHNFTMKTDPKTGRQYASFTDSAAERIVGALYDDPASVRTETDSEGTEWIVGRGRLWRFYAAELVDKIEHEAVQGRSMDISVETLVTEERIDGDVAHEEEWTPLGTTILGDLVQPAVPGAHIAAKTAISAEQFNALKLKAASYDGEKPNKPNESRKGETAMHDETVEQIQERFNAARADWETRESDLNAQVESLTAQNAALSADLDAAKTRVNELTEEAKTRRRAAAKNAARAQLDKINRNRDEEKKIPESEISGVLEGCEKGEYDDDDDEKCAEKACAAVRAVCMEKQMEQEAREAEVRRNQAQKRYAFEDEGGSGGGDPILDLFNDQ